MAQLDGLPLALELCAARLRILTAAEIVNRLHDKRCLLRDDVRALWAELAASWALLM